MFSKTVPSAFKRLLFAATLLALAPVTLTGKQVTTVQGTEPNGHHVVLIVQAETHEQSIGLFRQLASLPIQSGKLTLIEAESVPEAEELTDFLKNTLPNTTADWVWLHHGGRAGTDTPTLSLIAAGQGELQRLANEALDREVTIEHSPPEGKPLARRGVMTIAYPSNTPASRQNRFTRELTLAILRHSGMIKPDTIFNWMDLKEYSPRLIALYDAEGIGGGGPVSLERIAATKLADVGIYRVCGEDIREGALAPAVTSIFPGGSGRGIGTGLQDEGRGILRDYISGGGGYLGVCAGAYFAASGLDTYLGTIALTHSQPWQRGRSMIEIELTDEGKELFGDERTVMETRYANGPVFLPTDQEGDGDPNFVVLARFKTPSTDRNGVVREEMVGEAAIGSIRYGDGRIFIISPHPESHQEHYDFVARAISWTMAEKN